MLTNQVTQRSSVVYINATPLSDLIYLIQPVLVTLFCQHCQPIVMATYGRKTMCGLVASEECREDISTESIVYTPSLLTTFIVMHGVSLGGVELMKNNSILSCNSG